MLTDQQLFRFSRQLLVPQVDLIGQQKLLEAKVLVVGMGGIGNPLALYLASSGVGHLTLVDYDQVEVHNLPRQVLFTEADLGRSKVTVAAEKLSLQSPDAEIRVCDGRIEDLIDTLGQFDILVDATDSVTVAHALNRHSVQHHVPLLYLSAIGTEGRLFMARGWHTDAACLGCWLPELSDQNEGCERLGVLSPSVGAIGVLGAVQVIRALLGDFGEALVCFDTWSLNQMSISVSCRVDCPVCGQSTDG